MIWQVNFRYILSFASKLWNEAVQNSIHGKWKWWKYFIDQTYTHRWQAIVANHVQNVRSSPSFGGSYGESVTVTWDDGGKHKYEEVQIQIISSNQWDLTLLWRNKSPKGHITLLIKVSKDKHIAASRLKYENVIPLFF